MFRRRETVTLPPTFRFPTAGGAHVEVWPDLRWSCTGCGRTETAFTSVGAKLVGEDHAGRCHARAVG